jgi:hypothetical protein
VKIIEELLERETDAFNAQQGSAGASEKIFPARLRPFD